MKTLFQTLMVIALIQAAPAADRTYYVDPQGGNDQNDGLSPRQAWKSLQKAGSISYESGDRLLFKRGAVCHGSLALRALGTQRAPVVVDAFGTGAAPVIDAKGHVAGLALEGCGFLEINNLEITADGGDPLESGAAYRRFGVHLVVGAGQFEHLVLRGLQIHDIFASNALKNQAGFGIEVESTGGGTLRGLTIENCRIERTAATGIMMRGGQGTDYALRDIQILNNTLTDIGGPGMNPVSVTNLLVRGNVVNRSGSTADPRMRGRGSGIWPWGSDGVLIEKNTFQHARGINDCCGAHIDFNCRNVVVQYNLSRDNEGGFVEILGNNYNCCYRYNISVNDGARVKGAEWLHPNGTTLRAQLDGKTLFLSSYTGKTGTRCGPFNSYIYNNTIYVREDMHSVFNFTRCTEGALIANNIFCILGPTKAASDEEGTKNRPPASAALKNVIIRNNLYLRANTLPPDLPRQDGRPLEDTHPIVADPQFAKPGGSEPADYIPANRAAIRDRGFPIDRIPGDLVGLSLGLEVKEDFFGNPIVGAPDLGAVEIR